MISVSIDAWSAWTPGRSDRDRMEEWLSTDDARLSDLHGDNEPVVDALESRQLRRCSTITRMGLRAAFDCVGVSQFQSDEVQLVWVTQHGEIGVTIDLLEDLAGDEMLMPMAFSNSVPNTPAAYYDIASGNTLPTRTVCGGYDSFHQGLTDAVGLLHKNTQHPVLLVRADGMLPELLEAFNDPTAVPFGAALVLQKADAEAGGYCRAEPVNGDTIQPEFPPALEFLRWFLGTDESTKIPVREDGQWAWQRRE